MTPETIAQHIMNSFASVENGLRKNNITDPAQWAGKLLAGMNDLGRPLGFSACEKPGASGWGQWVFEIIWMKNDSPVKNDEENRKSTVDLIICEVPKSNEDAHLAPIREFNGSKPGDSYALAVRYTDNDMKRSRGRHRELKVDEANNSVYRDGALCDLTWLR